MSPGDLRIAAVQFEHRDGDKAFNLGRIAALTRHAVARGAEVVAFHECSISAYSFVQPLARTDLLAVAEPVPDGPSVQSLIAIAREHNVHLLAGLFERDGDRVHNTYVCVNADGFVAKHRKLHAFVSPHLTSGDEISVFEIRGWKCATLICYDNNLPENVRIAALSGAEIVFMPHVTGCLPSTMPGRGLVDPQLWEQRERDPVPLRQEFDGPKGRGWLMRWLPARAWENGIYAIFANPIGMDFGQVRNGNSMVLDPFGEVIAECRALGDDLCLAVCTREKLACSSGQRYLRARRPELYEKLVEPSSEPPLTQPGWTLQTPSDAAS
ncbi:MAG: nitrilase family protein [Planctomycetaceae bacterium]|nr:nitrilase family protein [Planctomycetaceae bacterium]